MSYWDGSRWDIVKEVVVLGVAIALVIGSIISGRFELLLAGYRLIVLVARERRHDDSSIPM